MSILSLHKKNKKVKGIVLKKISFAVNIILLVIVLFLIIYDRPASMIPFDNEQKEPAYGIKDYPLVDLIKKH